MYRNIFDTVADGLIINDLETGLVVEANPAACVMYGYTHKNFIGLPLTDLIHPESKKEFDKYIRISQSDGVFDTIIRHTDVDGSTLYAEWRGAAFTFQGKPCLLSTIREVSDGNHGEQLLHKRVETRTHEQETLLAISHTLASTLELQPGLILDQLREIIEYTHGGLFAVENTSLVTLAMRGTPAVVASPPFDIHLKGPEILAELLPEYHPIRIKNVWDETPESQALRSLLDDGAAVLLTGMQSWMWVPLTVKNRIFGCIGIAHEKRNHFTSHHADLALSVANQAAITMANVELYEQAQNVATLEERQRLARNLHDAINQSLFFRRYYCRGLAALMGTRPGTSTPIP